MRSPQRVRGLLCALCGLCVLRTDLTASVTSRRVSEVRSQKCSNCASSFTDPEPGEGRLPQPPADQRAEHRGAAGSPTEGPSAGRRCWRRPLSADECRHGSVEYCLAGPPGGGGSSAERREKTGREVLGPCLSARRRQAAVCRHEPTTPRRGAAARHHSSSRYSSAIRRR